MRNSRLSSSYSPRLVLASLLLALTVSANARADELTAAAVTMYPGLRVERIDYSGEYRTSRSKLASLTALREGMSLGEIDPDKVLQRLKKAGLYSEVSLGWERAGEGAAVTVTLKEKWTLVPLPIATYSDGSASLGLIFIDSDFLGSRSVLVAGGIWSNQGWTGILNYVDPTLRAGDLTFVLVAEGGDGRKEASDMDGSRFLSIDARYARLDGILNFRNRSALHPVLHLAYAFSTLDPASALSSGLRDSYAFVEGEGGLVLESRRNEGWYERGHRLSVGYTHGQSLISGQRYDAVQTRLGLTSLLGRSALLRLSATAEYGDRPIVVSPPLRGEGFRTLPFGESYAAKYAAASAGLELPFARPGWAVLTLQFFYEAGAYDPGRLSPEGASVFHGPGAGFRLYLKNIALPAMGVDLAYNVPARSPVFSIAIGMHG